eukprot:6172641-Pleurochrysis_carterae.AAC.1
MYLQHLCVAGDIDSLCRRVVLGVPRRVNEVNTPQHCPQTNKKLASSSYRRRSLPPCSESIFDGWMTAKSEDNRMLNWIDLQQNGALHAIAASKRVKTQSLSSPTELGRSL